MEIKPGKYFEIAYQLFRINADGSETLVHEVTADDPDRAVCGKTLGGVVVKLTPEAVVLDLNHPLAKDRVHYKGEIITVREATEEELNPQHGCCGGCGGGCGEGSSCGDGCCGGC